MGDPTQLHQVILNMCTNAFHAMQNSGGLLTIRLDEIQLNTESLDDTTDSQLAPGHYACLQISDTGVGMPPEIHERIFEPYFTTKAPGKGSGMGLAVSHGIINSFGGEIFVKSKVNEGTDISIFLPIVDAADQTLDIDISKPPSGNGEHVLIVDDEEGIANMEAVLLERLGYVSTTRVSSIEALEVFRAKPERFDVVVTDMTMPDLTGIQLSKRLLQIRPDIPIVLCTGYSEQVTLDKIRKIGIRELIFKPVLRKDIAVAIRKALNHNSDD